MADALLTPLVGATMWAVAGTATVACSRRVAAAGDDRLVPLMGVLGAFVLAAQMFNFALPGTGASGHLGGGLLLAILVGPCAALVVMTSVVVVQALFLGDGGLLALGCNVFNLGFVPAFVGLPLYRLMAGPAPTARRRTLAAVVAAVVSADLGALGIVLATTASGISALPFAAFAAVMLPIHALIGLVEGLATGAVLAAVERTRPGIVAAGEPMPLRRRVTVGLAIGAVAFLAAATWLSADDPDGLEWSIARVAGAAGLATPASAAR